MDNWQSWKGTKNISGAKGQENLYRSLLDKNTYNLIIVFKIKFTFKSNTMYRSLRWKHNLIYFRYMDITWLLALGCGLWGISYQMPLIWQFINEKESDRAMNLVQPGLIVCGFGIIIKCTALLLGTHKTWMRCPYNFLKFNLAFLYLIFVERRQRLVEALMRISHAQLTKVKTTESKRGIKLIKLLSVSLHYNMVQQMNRE